MVSSNDVEALTCGPKRAPIDSRNDTSSPGLKFSVPLNAMCSRKCARPRWSSSSWIDAGVRPPAASTRASSGRLVLADEIADAVRQPARSCTAGSTGSARSSASSGGMRRLRRRGLRATATRVNATNRQTPARNNKTAHRILLTTAQLRNSHCNCALLPKHTIRPCVSRLNVCDPAVGLPEPATAGAAGFDLAAAADIEIPPAQHPPGRDGTGDRRAGRTLSGDIRPQQHAAQDAA